jgi:phage-related minor tail protein
MAASFLASVPKKQYALGGAFKDGKQVFGQGGAFHQGVVDTPTDFSIGQMGEAGPEAIVPLKEMADGSLGVASAGGGVPDILNINLMLDGEIIASATVDLINRNQTPKLKGLNN